MTSISTTGDLNATDEAYALFERAVAERIGKNRVPLFMTATDSEVLWKRYLEGIPVPIRQHYSCHCCRDFIRRYGGLVVIDPDSGYSIPLLWGLSDVAAPFDGVAFQLYSYVQKARVIGPFRWSNPTWGVSNNFSEKHGRRWTHLHGIAQFEYAKRGLDTPEQQAMALRTSYATLSRGLGEFSIDVVRQAVRVLDADALTRSEDARGVATWLLKLQEKLVEVKGRQRDNLVWLAAVTAPVGYPHIRSTVIGTLLADIKAGLPFDAIKARWAEKMHPLKKSRPQAPPKAGNIAQAEKLVAEMGLAPSLQRRYARMEDITHPLWTRPTVDPVVDHPMYDGSVFNHLRRGKNAPVQELEIPPKAITWEKFQEKALPTALSIEIYVPSTGGFYGLVTAANPDAPPILQWDGLSQDGTPLPRNPVSWYFYHDDGSSYVANGTRAQHWNLKPKRWIPVNAVFLSPHQWQIPERFQHQTTHVFFALEGCVETTPRGLALFPEMLRSELHEVRAVIEAHSRSVLIEGSEEGNANGIAFPRTVPSWTTLSLRVRSAEGMSLYNLDRWE